MPLTGLLSYLSYTTGHQIKSSKLLSSDGPNPTETNVGGCFMHPKQLCKRCDVTCKLPLTSVMKMPWTSPCLRWNNVEACSILSPRGYPAIHTWHLHIYPPVHPPSHFNLTFLPFWCVLTSSLNYWCSNSHMKSAYGKFHLRYSSWPISNGVLYLFR